MAHAVASAAETAALIALTIAQDGLTAAMALCPWTWIAYAVIAIVAAFYVAIAVINHFAGTSISATGVIFAVFAWVGTMIYNVFVVCFNNVIGIINLVIKAFVAVANFFGSVFQDPAKAVYNLFIDIWDGIVSYVQQAVNNIIGMINKIPGIDKVLGTVGNVALPQLERKEIENPAFKISTPQISYIEQADAKANASGAYDYGADLPNKFKDMMPKMPGAPGNDGDNNAAPPGTGLPEALNEGSGPAKDTAGNTGRMADKMDDLDTDLKYLREVAEQEIINKYTTAEIKIDMGGVRNTVSSDVDLDGMMSYMGESLFEAMQSGAEKVHP
jgi:hypothetical protein